MRMQSIAVSTLALLTIAGGTAAAQETLRGTVEEVFGNSLLLETSEGRRLVETGPPDKVDIRVEKGEEVSVTGRTKNGKFEAIELVAADGTRDVIRPAEGPPPWAGKKGAKEKEGKGKANRLTWREASDLVANLESKGYSDIREVEIKPQHVEVDARDQNGRKVELHVNRDGRVRIDD